MGQITGQVRRTRRHSRTSPTKLRYISTNKWLQEEKIYENPADESRAPELWANANLWLKIEKLMYVQMEAVNSLRSYMKEIALDEREFFNAAPDQYKRIENLIDEDLIKPTQNLNDLVSVLGTVR